MSEGTEGKKASRAPRIPGQGRRPTITFRCRPDLQSDLQDAALKADRSLSEEIEHRLHKSFYEKELIDLVREISWNNAIESWKDQRAVAVGGRFNDQVGFTFASVLASLQIQSDNAGGDRSWTRDRVKALVEEKGASEMIPALLAYFPFPSDMNPHSEDVRREEERERTRKLHEQKTMQPTQK